MRLCSADDCAGKHYAKGYCEKHYVRLRKHGDPLAVRYASRPSGRIDTFLRTGRSRCPEHGEHADWNLRVRIGQKNNAPYRTLECCPCRRATARDGYERKLPQERTAYRESIRGKAYTLAYGAQRRAAKAGLPCSITQEWIVDQYELQDGRCAYTGWRFDNTSTGRGYARNFYGMSLDRVDSTDGYTAENTRLICWGVNRAKGDLPMQTFVEMCRAVAGGRVERC